MSRGYSFYARTESLGFRFLEIIALASWKPANRTAEIKENHVLMKLSHLWVYSARWGEPIGRKDSTRFSVRARRLLLSLLTNFVPMKNTKWSSVVMEFRLYVLNDFYVYTQSCSIANTKNHTFLFCFVNQRTSRIYLMKKRVENKNCKFIAAQQSEIRFA